MTALEQVNTYLQQLTRRLRLLAVSRGAAISAGAALTLTLLLADIANRYQFAPGVLGPFRLVLYASLAAVLFFALLRPARKITKQNVTRLVEQAAPELQERLLTASERPDPSNPFTELVAEDALRVARETAPKTLEPGSRLWAYAAAAAFGFALLLWLIAAGPGPWGYGASLLWTGSAHARQRPLYEVLVQPGNKTIRRKSGQVIQAQLVGFTARKVTLHARSGKGLKWEETVMQPGSSGDRYQFLLAAVTDATEYFVQADASRSEKFTISVKDLPAIRNVRVTLHFPQALRLKPVSNESGGDVRAVEGSQAEISVLTDSPLKHGLLVLDKGGKIALTPGDGNWSKATVPVKQDGAYHVAVVDGGETIRISDDYFIEARKDEPPTIRIARPGGDPRVSPIEELPVMVEAADDFGVRSLELHYAVNGGPEQITRFRAQNGKEENGHTTLYLESFKLTPGDVVSLSATAADANKTVRSDILFAQAEAFDYKFSQSQQAGNMGGGGGGDQDTNISARQKQIIAATFNQLRTDGNEKSALREQARFLSDLESKLGAQAKTLAERMGNRELTQANPEFENFSKLMTSASDDMGTAARQLSPGKWNDALTPEQKALQSLLRAEAIFRNIQVAFGQQGGAGAGGAQRELARMFDLELDTSKNQYETGQQGGGSDKQQKALDDAFERLQMLARRQQELAQQHNGQQAAEQRWQEEQLRREAEELKRQLQQLSQNGQNGQQSSQQNTASQGQRGQSGGSAQAGGSQNREVNEAMRQASNSVSQAEDEMRKAVGNGDASAQQRALNQLAEAQRRLGNALHRSAGSSLSDLTAQADSLAGRQRDLAHRMKSLYSGPTGQNRGSEFSGQLGGESGEMPEMNDPDNPRFGYGYRRRNWMQEMRPTHRATDEEKSLAEEKEKLAAQVEQLQRGIEDQEQALRAGSPQAARQLQKALSDAEQKELALRMQKNAQWIREGYGDRNLAMEDNVTAGLDQLSKDLRGAQRTLQADGDPLHGQPDKRAQALAQVRQLREMLERARAGQSGAEQPGSPQNGITGESGAPGVVLGGEDSDGRGLSQRDLDQAINRLSTLRGQISGQDRALGNYLGGTLGHLRDLNADPRVLQATIGQDAVASLERLEAELTRRLGEQQAGGARSGAAEKTTEQYREAVAEYFKKLSQPAPKN